MITFSDILAVIGLFVLRIGVPIAVIAGLVYALKRLDQRWQEEAETQLPAEPPVSRPAQREAEKPARQPVKQPAAQVGQTQRVAVPMPVAQRSFDPARRQPGLAARAEGQPCWDVKGCAEAAKAQCGAFAHPEQACWQARLEAEGKIPETCPSCEIFQRYPLI